MKLQFQAIHIRDWNPLRLTQLLRELQGKRVAVVGDVGVDRYTIGLVERISPEAPVPIVLVEEELHKLGLAANVADNVAVLGGHAHLIGVIGADVGAGDFKRLLKRAKISPDYLITDRERRTVLKERIVSDKQQLLRVDYESQGPVAEKVRAKLLARLQYALGPGRADAVIFEDYAKGLASQEFAQKLFSLVARKKKWVTVDPNAKSSVEFYRGAHVLTPNTREAEKLAGLSIRCEATLAEAGFKILKATGAKHVVITRGREGMAIFSKGSQTIRLIETYAREVFDVSGAGDTVIAVLTLALTAGASIEEACILGNLAAGVEVGKRGTATVTVEEIQSALDFFIRAAQSAS